MRKLALTILACTIVPGAAYGQDTPPASADDFVCTFSGDCDGDDAAAADDPQAERPRGRLTATRGFVLSGPEGGNDRNTTTTRRSNPPQRQRRARNLATSSSPPPTASAGQRVNLRLSFDSGSANLTGAARAQAEAFAQALLRPQLRNMRFQIEGHTDSVGSRTSNINLSQRRAQTLADFLASRGVDPGRLVVRGYGPDRPLPGLRGNAGDNRRVEVVRVS
jgi:OOP family OmpA-OmpF porin